MDVRCVRVEAGAPYEVRIAPGVLAELPARASAWPAWAVLSDENVVRLWAERALGGTHPPLLAVPAGEGSKCFAVLERVLDFLAAAGLDRRSCLVALGGGVIGDLGGLAASLYQRGIAFLQVPTSLLAMVDSSVGGKTAVNLAAGKNLAGSFHQPALVLADPLLLESLPEEELRSGLGEVLKTALVAGETALARLEALADGLLRREPEALAETVELCVRVKAHVVARDEREAGERRALNLGHTFAHGLEHAAGYGRIPHGIAVAAGLGLALRASAELGLLEERELPARVAALARRLGLPAGPEELDFEGARPTAEAVLAGMRHDKKGAAGRPRFVLVRAAGRLELEVELEPELLARLLEER